MVVRKRTSSHSRTSAREQVGAFHDSTTVPSDRELAATLGPAESLWSRFATDVRASCGPLTDEWSFSKAFGWTLRLKHPTRVLVYLTPGRSHFLASFVLGDKACNAIRAARVPAAILAMIEAAPQYAEGRGVRIQVRTKRELNAVLKIAGLKSLASK